jgi:tetratricopeptide (TPR) repeat protein
MEDMLRRMPALELDKPTNDGDGEESAAQEATVAVGNSTSELDTAHASIASPAVAASSPVQPSTNVRARRMWQMLAVALLCVALVAGALAFILSRRASSTDAEGSSPISISDQKQLVGEKLAEAEVLLGSGEFNRAITALRAAVKLDPSSLEAHMRLGSALERTGATTEAIEEYRAATQSNPNNVAAWRALASAQFEEKLYNDAAESYRRLTEAASESDVGDETRLAYADALRLSGRTEDARAVYQKIAAANHEAAQAARQHLAELGPPAVAANTERSRDEHVSQQADTQEATLPKASPTPLARSGPPAPVNNTAQTTDPDAYYFKALNIVNGRDPKKLSDGELTAALNYFLRAQGGAHSAEASRNAERLGREYDRRRKR